MKKFFTLCGLFLLALMPWESAMAQSDTLKTLNAAADGKIFTIKTARGYWYADQTKNRISASKGDFASVGNNVEFKDVTNKSQFAFIKATYYDSYYCLYNVDTHKWLIMRDAQLGLSDAPSVPLSFSSLVGSTGNNASAYPSCIYFGFNEQNMYGVSPTYTPDVFKYHGTADGGNQSALLLTGQTVTNLSELKAQLDAALDAVLNTNSDNRLDAFSTSTVGQKFIIGGKRGCWKSEPANNWVTYTLNPLEATKYAVVDVDGRYFLYDADNNLWVTPASGSPDSNGRLALSVNPTLAEVGLLSSTNASLNTKFPSIVTFFYGSRQYGVSPSFSGSKVVSYNNTNDEGNAAALMKTGETVGQEALRQTIKDTYVTPFVLSTGDDPSKWVWYHVTMRNNTSTRKVYLYADDTNSPKLSLESATTFADQDAYLWAFKATDNPAFTKFAVQIFNKKKGANMNLKVSGSSVVMGAASEGSDNHIISMGGQDGSGFNLRTSLDVTTNNYLNDVNKTLGLWNHANAKTDDGSTFRVELAEGFVTLQNYFDASGRNTAYGYMGANASVTGLDATAESVGLRNVAQITPTLSTGKVKIAFEGKLAQTVANSNQATLGDTNVEYKVGRGQFFPYYITLGTGTGQYEYLHENVSHSVVGWETSAGATNWKVAPAQDIQMTANEVGDKFYATLHAPFALQISGATAYTAKVNDAKNALVLTEVPGGLIPANTGVVVIASTRNYTVTPVQSVAKALDTDLTGVNAATAWDSNNLSLGRNNGVAGFYKWSGTTLAANKAYLRASKLSESGARGLAFDFGGTTAIQGVETQNGKTGKVYNLQGQQVGDNYRGIVIVNGKKVIK